MRWIAVACLVALAGCNKTVAEMNYTERQQLAQELVKRCNAQGVKDGSPQMEACMKAEFESESAIRERRARQADAVTFCSPVGYSVVCY